MGETYKFQIDSPPSTEGMLEVVARLGEAVRPLEDWRPGTVKRAVVRLGVESLLRSFLPALDREPEIGVLRRPVEPMLLNVVDTLRILDRYVETLEELGKPILSAKGKAPARQTGFHSEAKRLSVRADSLRRSLHEQLRRLANAPNGDSMLSAMEGLVDTTTNSVSLQDEMFDLIYRWQQALGLR